MDYGEAEALRKVANLTRLGEQKDKRTKLAEAREAAVESKQKEVEKLAKELELLQMKAAAAKAKAEAADTKAGVKAMSKAAVRWAVKLRLARQSGMDGHSDANENVWEAIYAEYKAKLEDGTLDKATDDVALATLKSRFCKEDKSFTLYAAERMRREQSGAPRTDIDAITIGVTCTTDLFWEAKRHEMAKTIPPFHIDDENAGRGGQPNIFVNRGGRKRKAAGTSAADAEADGGGEDGLEDGDRDDGEDEDGGEEGDPGSDFFSQHGGPSSHPPLHIGGSAKAKQRPDKTPADPMLAYLKAMRAEDKQADKKREKRARKERASGRKFQLMMLQISMGHKFSQAEINAAQDSEGGSSDDDA